jgi:hypothetical protein
MFAPISGSPVTLSKTTPFIEPDPAANKDCVIISIIAVNALASLLRVKELTIVIFFSFQ